MFVCSAAKRCTEKSKAIICITFTIFIFIEIPFTEKLLQRYGANCPYEYKKARINLKKTSRPKVFTLLR